MPVRLVDLELFYGVAGARDQFENLCAKLIHSKYPKSSASVRVQRGDGGVDTYVGNWAETGGIRVFQVKFFPKGLGDSQRHQIINSYQTCLSNPSFKTHEWTLCLPVDLSQNEIIWFDKWAQEVETDHVNLNWWGATQLETLLYDSTNQGIKEAFFKEEHLTQIREMHSTLHEMVTRLGGPDKETLRKRLDGYIQRIKERAEKVVNETINTLKFVTRFDAESLRANMFDFSAAFPYMESPLLDIIESLEEANRLGDEVNESLKNPPAFRLNSHNIHMADNLSITDVELWQKQQIANRISHWQVFVSQYVIPKAIALINQLNPK